ncbi:hypothetical protein HAX54_013295 [Datura stramonium]|uniref:5'-3' exonuclease domain-containing protein n=1 Tax=Datura stramonium TaxID=4076 RepID=A0ABS8TL47_DATST|nr:hypothetical protein [Datura stramonium]
MARRGELLLPSSIVGFNFTFHLPTVPSLLRDSKARKAATSPSSSRLRLLQTSRPGCILGDEVDGVPGIQHVVPGFGRKTALKLLKKHGTLENLLSAAAVRSVGRQYAQDALIKYADYLRRNYEVLSLKRDVSIHIEEQWLNERDVRNDSPVLSNFITLLKDSRNLNSQNRSHSIG